MASKAALVFSTLEGVLSGFTTTEIKLAIGDSINNNRVATVSQVIRFLKGKSNRKLKILGANLEVAYGVIKEDILSYRTATNFRTDAIDINEFLTVYFDLVVEGGGGSSFVRSLGRQLAA